MNHKILFLFIILFSTFDSQSGKLTQEDEEKLFEKYSKIGIVLKNFYNQKVDNATLSKRSVKIIYQDFLERLTPEELELVKDWNQRELIPQPKWLTKD